MKLKTLLLCIVAIMVQTASAQKAYNLSSPNKKLKISVVNHDNGELTYSFVAHGKTLISASPIGVDVNGDKAPFKITNTSNRKVKTVWNPLWGKRSVVPDVFNELTLELTAGQAPLTMIFRAYDDGVAFRYLTPSAASGRVCELTKYNFAGDYRAWFYNGENHNIGPEKLSDYGGHYLPVMTIQVDNHNYMALHEADLAAGQPLVLETKNGSTSFGVVSDGGNLVAGASSAWRVIMYGSTPGDLVDTHLIELLNPEPAAGLDFSWVTTGVAVWDWRIDGAIVGDFTYSMSYPSWVRMVDFAAQNGIKSLVLDANWYGPEHEAESDPIEGEKAADVQRLLEYGKQKGVGIWLYLNDVGGRKYDIEKTLAQYGAWGAVGVKYGFMSGSPEERNAWTRRITELCAANRLMVNFHDGPVHPYGQMRTWPNAVTREYCHAQLDAHRVFQPKTFVTSVFVNMVAGPIDMNNGMFDLRQGHTTRVDESQPVPSTVVSEAARTLIVFSGATVLPDIPEFYNKYPDLLRFIAAQQMPWVESRTLAGEIGEYIVMCRETKDCFLVGAATNESARELDVALDFLPKGDFEMLLVQDAADSHYLTNREQLRSETLMVNNRSKVKISMAPGGGACMLIRKAK